MIHKWLVMGVWLLSLTNCAPDTPNLTSGTVSVRLMGLQTDLFDDVQSVIFLPFEASTQEDCLSLDGADLEQLSEIESNLEFIAARKLNTSLQGTAHPADLTDQVATCQAGTEDTAAQEACHIPYFRYKFGALEPGSLTLLAWGTSEPISVEEAKYGYFSSSNMTVPDGGVNTGNDKLTFLERFYPQMTAFACLKMHITAGVNKVKPMELFPVGACCNNGRCDVKTETDCSKVAGQWNQGHCNDESICDDSEATE